RSRALRRGSAAGRAAGRRQPRDRRRGRCRRRCHALQNGPRGCATVGSLSPRGHDDRPSPRRPVADTEASDGPESAAEAGERMDRPISGAGGGRTARPSAHELARYEALFAARTRGMKSSAMREMMALTERPDVISLAGGLPDTSTFEPELYAKLMSQV